MTRKPQRRADGGPVTRVVDPPRPAKVRDVDKMADEYRKRAPPRLSYFPDPDSSKSDLKGFSAPPPTRDTGEYGSWPVKNLNPKPSQVSMAKGGKITRVAGKPVGKEDGLIAVQKGEFVVRKAAVQKHGPAKMAAVNKGTARITIPKGGKRK